MTLSDIESRATKFIKDFNLDKKDVIEAVKLAGIFVLIYVAFKLWRKSREEQSE